MRQAPQPCKSVQPPAGPHGALHGVAEEEGICPSYRCPWMFSLIIHPINTWLRRWCRWWKFGDFLIVGRFIQKAAFQLFKELVSRTPWEEVLRDKGTEVPADLGRCIP